MNNLNLNDVEVLEIDDFNDEISMLDQVPKPPLIEDFQKNKNLKKQNGKVNFKIILIIVLIILIGLGLYFFLNFAKNKINSQVKIEEKVLELGQELDKNTINYKNCKVDLSDIDTKKVGKYKYIIECDNKKYTSNAYVKDTTSPIISLKILNIEKNQNFEAKDFILNAYDLSNISYKFTNDENSLNYNQENGIYVVPITAIDEYKNKVEDYGIVVVTNTLANKYLSASKVETTNYNATLKITDKIGFNSVNYYLHSIRIYEYTFNSKDEYEKVKNESLETNTIDGNAGKIITDDEKLMIKLVKELSKEELNTLSGSFPATYNDISTLYYKLGYTNKIEMN